MRRSITQMDLIEIYIVYH